MSLQKEPQKTGNIYMPVICWRCDAPMKIKTVMPAMTSLSIDEVVYSCPACHDERKQTVRRVA
jgi:predicted nucleic acid-binding Zn ribbon protein